MKTLFFILLIALSFSSRAEIYPYVKGNRLTLLEDNRDSADFKLELVRNAKHHIHIITFFWDDSKFPKQLERELIKANQRGVEVRILTTFFPSFATDLTGKARRSLNDVEGKEAVFSFHALKSYDNLILLNSLHEKIFLVDGEKAILGGRNISDSRFKGKDMEVLLEGEVVNQVQDHFYKMNDFVINLTINHKCKRESSKKCKRTKETLNRTRFPKESLTYFPEQPSFVKGIEARILTHNVLFDQMQNNHRNTIDRMDISDDIVNVVINTPFKKLRGYNYFIIPTPTYKKFLEESLKNGKEIEIITNSLKSASSVDNKGYLYGLPDMIDLSKKGLNIIEWQGKAPQTYLHEKVMIFDNDHVIIGSHNFGVGSTSVSNEIAIEFKSEEIAGHLINVFDTEKTSPDLARAVDTEFLENMLHKNRFMVKALRLSPVKQILREIF